jgi:hypothetical protein
VARNQIQAQPESSTDPPDDTALVQPIRLRAGSTGDKMMQNSL